MSKGSESADTGKGGIGIVLLISQAVYSVEFRSVGTSIVSGRPVSRSVDELCIDFFVVVEETLVQLNSKARVKRSSSCSYRVH